MAYLVYLQAIMKRPQVNILRKQASTSIPDTCSTSNLCGSRRLQCDKNGSCKVESRRVGLQCDVVVRTLCGSRGENNCETLWVIALPRTNPTLHALSTYYVGSREKAYTF